MFGARRLTATGRVALAVTLATTAAVTLLAIMAYLGIERRLAAETDRALLDETRMFAQALREQSRPGAATVEAAVRSYLSALSA